MEVNRRTVVKDVPIAPPLPDYEKELLVRTIADQLCADNEEVRGLIRVRLKDMTLKELQVYTTENNIVLI